MARTMRAEASAGAARLGASGRRRWGVQVVALVVVAAVSGLLVTGADRTFVRPALVSVPEVRGQDPVVARAALERLGLQVAETITSPAGFRSGEVASQRPPVGAGLRPGGVVELGVAARPVRIEVRKNSYVGRRTSEAETTLRALGFVVSTERAVSEIASGTVIDVSPDGPVMQGEPVRIVVSKGVG